MRTKRLVSKSAMLNLEGNLGLKIGWDNLWLEGRFMSVICRKVLLKLALRT